MILKDSNCKLGKMKVFIEHKPSGKQIYFLSKRDAVSHLVQLVTNNDKNSVIIKDLIKHITRYNGIKLLQESYKIKKL